MTDRTLSEDEFRDTYKPIDPPNGQSLWEHKDTLSHDIHHVWSIMVGDDGEGGYAETGYHVVNVEGYVVTQVPWVTGGESGVWWDPEYHDFDPLPDDVDTCGQCGRERDLEGDPIHDPQD